MRNWWRLTQVVVLLLAISAQAGAEPTSQPAGPWITPNQNVSLEGFECYGNQSGPRRLACQSRRSAEHTGAHHDTAARQ